ncbi:MAG: TIGR04283 family arsenosugar biosynthesis glycosyltransferase [Bacteroidia bacterium]|nr:TIGR04283 family arsenosugar biosynthesis glycosyltransferase [Bacteroidia bacterium]
MRLSVIIPTINEAKRIQQLVKHLNNHGGNELEEIIVVDAGSTDMTCQLARDAGAKVLEVEQKSRAIQMNIAAAKSKGDVLYFVHADTLPPESYVTDIEDALDSGHTAGSYRFKFDSKSKLLGINSFFTRFDALVCRGGDQSMFITRELFASMDGFDEAFVIMEDFDFIRRLKKKTDFHVIQKDILVSDRKYENNSYLRVQIANFLAFSMFKRGITQQRIKSFYERILDLSYD